MQFLHVLMIMTIPINSMSSSAMTRIASMHANQPLQRPTIPKADTSAPTTFTRKPNGIEKTAKDKAIISPAGLARELDTQFPHAGHYFFRFGGANEAPALVERFTNGLMSISGPGDRVVIIRNGEIIDRYDHVVPDDTSAFLSAAKNAR